MKSINKLRVLAFIISVACTSLFHGPAAVAADAADVPLPAGGSVVVEASQSVGLLKLGGTEAPQTTKVVQVEVTDMPFTTALRADVSKASNNNWDSQFTIQIEKAIAKDDVLLARIWARCEWSMTGQSSVPILFEQNAEPWEKSADFQTAVGAQWQQIDVPFVARADLAAGKSQLVIRLGTAKHTIDIGPIEVINFGKGISLDVLPRTLVTYNGREPGAAWRKAADERIDKLRKADLIVKVVDAQGQPVEGATVDIELQRHAFGFGTAVSADAVLGKSANNERYRKELLRLFNCVVIENDLKWPNLVANGYDKPSKLIDWLEQHDMPVRGHTLVWPGKDVLPAVALARLDKPEEFRALIHAHIKYTTQFFRGRLIDWDVINEPFTNRLVEENLGKEAYVEFFKLAHEADPNCKLYINDFSILETSNQLSTPQLEHYFETIKYLQEQGAPLHGIGIQGHFASNLSSPDVLLAILDRFGSFGLPIKITELDINSTDRQMQADYLRDFMTVCFSHKSVEGILQWGFWSKAHWMPDAALFDESWNLRPVGESYETLVKKTWHTKASKVTDAQGKAAIRGFKGVYEVTVKSGTKQVVSGTILASDGDTVTVTLP